MLLKGSSPLFAAWWSIVAVFAATWLRPSQGMRLKDLIWTLESGARITVPVALTSYSAASVARADPTRTAFEALKIIGPAFILPYLFVYYPAVLMKFENVSDLVVSAIRILSFIFGTSLFLARYLFTEINPFRRILYAVTAILVIINIPALYFSGMALLVILVLINWFKKREKSIDTVVASHQ